MITMKKYGEMNCITLSYTGQSYTPGNRSYPFKNNYVISLLISNADFHLERIIPFSDHVPLQTSQINIIKNKRKKSHYLKGNGFQ